MVEDTVNKQRFAPRTAKSEVAPNNYSHWQRHRLTERVEKDLQTGRWNHLISIAVIGAGESEEDGALAATLLSLLQQTYRNIEVLLLEGLHGDFHHAQGFVGYRGLFSEPERSHLDLLSDSGTERLWRGSHLMFARLGTVFDPDALARLNAALNTQALLRRPDLVLCDHDRLIGTDEYADPSFTPGWDPDLIQEFDYIDTAFLASRALIHRHRARSLCCASLHDWLRQIAEQETDLVTYHVTEPIVHLPQHDKPAPPSVQSKYALPVAAPRLAVIVPNRNRPDLLQQCLRFMEFEKHFKVELVVVDNASDDSMVGALYTQLESRYRAKIVSMNHKFNFARMVNLGVAASTAETFLLLNNDVEITSPKLVEQFLAHALRTEVGVVGGKLLNGDGTVQHGGMLLEEGHAGAQTMLARHVLRGAPRDDPGYLGALSCVRNYQAVTGALMASRRDVFLKVGGFDEVHLPVEFNDVDYCLRLRQAGYRVLCLPLDGIFHRESSTRGSKLSPEILRMRQAAMAVMAGRWREAFRDDPYRNPWAELGDVSHVRFPWSSASAGVP